MKKFSYIFKSAIMVTFTMLMAMCANGNNGGSGDYRNAIPKDANFVFSINPNSICEKAGVDNIKDLAVYEKSVTELERTGIPDSQLNYIKSLMEDPEKTGIDIKENAYVFLKADPNSSSYSPDFFGGFLLKMNNKTKFDEVVGFASDVSEGEISKTTVSGTDVVVLKEGYGEQVILAYTNSSALFYVKRGELKEVTDEAVNLLKQGKEKSILSNGDIASKLTNKNDIDFIVSMSDFPTSLMGGASNIMVKRLLNSVMGYSINFEKGKIASDISLSFLSKDAQEEFDKLDASAGKQKGDLLKYIPESSIMVLGGTLDGAKLYDALSTMKEFAMFRMMPQVKQVFSAVNGDMAISICGLKPYNYDVIPEFSMLVTLKDTKAVDTIIEQFSDMLKETAPKQYEIDLGRGIVITLGVKDKILYATNNKDTKSAVGGKKIESFDDKRFKGNYGTVIVDMNKLSDIILQTAGDQNSARQAANVLKTLDSVELYADSRVHAAFDVNMADKSQNSAKTIYEIISALVEAQL